jgi:RimJ/RimL family protein N-acetyltransferase
MIEITTDRLTLIPLGIDQLRAYLDGAQELAGIPVSRVMQTDRLRRAIGMKIENMVATNPSNHPWLTYWLIVIREDGFGAGMAGFKGVPDEVGEVEIGYGIDPGYQGKGYTTEAVKALIERAFQDERCRSVSAPNTERGNVASNKVLKKVGMSVYEESEDSLSWRIDKDEGPMGGVSRLKEDQD